MNLRKDIQILRGFSVVCVVLYHLQLNVFKTGFLGVDLFFVISGFLMATLYKEGEWKAFFKRRAQRLLPAYFVTIIFVVGLSYIFITPNEYRQVIDQAIYATFFVPNIGYWGNISYFDTSAFNPLLHLWSLGVEIQFYLIVPLLAYLFAKNKIWLVIFLLVSAVACFSFLYISPKTSFFMMPMRVWEFLVGFYVAKNFSNAGEKVFSNGRLGGVFLCAFFVIALIDVDGKSKDVILGHPGLASLLVALLASGVLIFGLPKALESSGLGKLFVLLGDYSYSIYLVHFPLIVLWLYMPFSGTQLLPSTINQTLLILAGISILSVGMYWLVEKKFRKSNIFFTVIFLIVAVPILGTISRDLQLEKYNVGVRGIFKSWEDRSKYRCGMTFRLTHPTAVTCELTSGVIGDDAVLLVGDSHSDSIKVALSEALQRKNIHVYFLVSNKALKPNGLTAQRISEIARDLNARSMVLHFSRKNITVNAVNDLVTMAASQKILVHFIAPVPTWNVDIPLVLYENFKMDRVLPVQTIEEYQKTNNSINEPLKAISASNYRFYQVDKYLCQPHCRFKDEDGKVLYFDDSHLTLTGAKQLKSLFEIIAQEHLRGLGGFFGSS